MFRTPVHIRLYRGPERMVALVSEPVSDGSRIAYNRFDQIMAVVEDEFLVPIERTVQDVVWIHLTPVKTYSGALPTKVENVVAELNPQERSPVGYARPGWNVRHHYLDPDCLPDLLGGVEPDRFYWEHYTPEVITAWQRTGRPVPVTHDILEAQGSVTALQLLESEGVTTAGLSPELLQHVTSWLLHELSLRCSPNGRQMYEASGVKPDPAVRTTKLIPYQIPEAIQRRLDADPSFTDEQASLVEKGYQLYDALMNVDQYADHPRPDLESAIRSALTAHGDALISAGYFPWEVFRPEPAFTPRTFTARGRWDHAYLPTAPGYPKAPTPSRPRPIWWPLTWHADCATASATGATTPGSVSTLRATSWSSARTSTARPPSPSCGPPPAIWTVTCPRTPTSWPTARTKPETALSTWPGTARSSACCPTPTEPPGGPTATAVAAPAPWPRTSNPSSPTTAASSTVSRCGPTSPTPNATRSASTSTSTEACPATTDAAADPHLGPGHGEQHPRG